MLTQGVACMHCVHMPGQDRCANFWVQTRRTNTVSSRLQAHASQAVPVLPICTLALALSLTLFRLFCVFQDVNASC